MLKLSTCLKVSAIILGGVAAILASVTIPPLVPIIIEGVAVV